MGMSENGEREVTIVCCYNDSEQYGRLCASLETQNLAYELIGIDNRGKKFSSCSKALNSVISQVQTEYLIYSHQDIELPETDMLERFVNYLAQIGGADILGVAGAAETTQVLGKADASQMLEKGRIEGRIGDKDGTCVLSHVRHGESLMSAGEVEYEGLVECDTIDECFFGGRTEIFEQEPLDEAICDNWHLYAVERCLKARARGNKVWVCDLPLLHYSVGKINHAYNENFRRIAAHYAKISARKGQKNAEIPIKYMRTVCGSARTDFLHRNLFYWKREILFLLHRL